MQVSSLLSPQAVSPSAGDVVAQVKQQAAILADGSSASDQEKIAAYVSIMRAYADSSNSGSGWFQSTTQDDRDAVNAVLDTASMSKQIRKAADDFNARCMSADRTTNVMASQISYLDGLSDTQQQMIFAGSALTAQTPTLESWKGFLQENADGRAKQMADEAAQTASVKVTLSDQAKATLETQPSSDQRALDALIGGDPEDGVAGAALKMLRKAAEDRAKAVDQTASTSAETKSYETGDTVDKVV